MLVFMMVAFLHRDKRFVPSPLNGTVILFTLTLLLSGAFSLSWDQSWGLIGDYLKYVVFYFMVILSIRDENDFRIILLAFLGVMFLYVGKSAWEFFIHDRYVYRMGIKRMMGIDTTYGDPNSFAASICYSLPLTWALIRSGFRKTWVARMLWLYVGLSLAAIMFTGSRSGMVTFLVFLVLLFLGTSRKLLGIVLVGALLVASWSFMPDDLKDRFLSTFDAQYAESYNGAEASAKSRAAGFLHGLELFRQNPALGIGPHNFPLTWPGGVAGMNAHNLYGQLLGELGTVGLVTFGLLLWLIYRLNTRIIVRSRRMEAAEAGGCAAPLSTPVSREAPAAHAADLRRRPDVSSPLDMASIAAVASMSKFHRCVAQAIIQTMILMLFKGWADHSLYRYSWLWLAALTVLGSHFFELEVARRAVARAGESVGSAAGDDASDQGPLRTRMSAMTGRWSEPTSRPTKHASGARSGPHRM
jgi:O-antigen ligase